MGFVGAEREQTAQQARGEQVTHRLPQLINWLDYLLELGANGLLLAPIFASTSHGYDTVDHLRIDPRLGDDADLDRLVATCRERGIRVLLDGVFNHVSREHEIVRRALAAPPGAPERAWLRWSGEHPYCFEGHLDLVELDLTHPPVQEHVAQVMDHWLRRGVDGWRLDAAYAAGPDVWRPIVSRVRERHPQCWILGEVIHGDYVDFVERSGLDSVTQYELWKAIWSSINDGNLFELAWALGRHEGFCRVFRPQTFLGNHDVTRIATQLTDPRHLPLAVALLATLPGVPSVYAGDEQGFTGAKLDQPGGDDPVRPPFPDDPSGLVPFGAGLLRTYQELVGLRRRHAWLGGATIATPHVANHTLVVELTGERPGERLLLGLNLTDQPVDLAAGDVRLPVPAHGWAVG